MEYHEVLDPAIDDVPTGQHAPGPLQPMRRVATKEQRRIPEHVPQPGDRVRISAVKSSGQTTTCVMLAGRILQRDPESRIALLTFRLCHGNAGKVNLCSTSQCRWKQTILFRGTHSHLRRPWLSIRVLRKLAYQTSVWPCESRGERCRATD